MLFSPQTHNLTLRMIPWRFWRNQCYKRSTIRMPGIARGPDGGGLGGEGHRWWWLCQGKGVFHTG